MVIETALRNVSVVHHMLLIIWMFFQVADVISRKLRKIKEKDGGHGRSWQMRHAQKLGEMLPAEPVDISPLLERKASDLPDEVSGSYLLFVSYGCQTGVQINPLVTYANV